MTNQTPSQSRKGCPCGSLTYRWSRTYRLWVCRLCIQPLARWQWHARASLNPRLVHFEFDQYPWTLTHEEAEKRFMGFNVP